MLSLSVTDMTGDTLPASIVRLKYRSQTATSKAISMPCAACIASLVVMILKLEEALQNAQILGKT